MRKDLEEINIQQEATVLSLRKKHQDAILEMSEQIDQLGKLKARTEKDNVSIKHEIEEIKIVSDEVTRAKAIAEKAGKTLSEQVNVVTKKITEANLQLNDLDCGNRKSSAENNDLLHQLGEIDQNVSLMQKLRHQLNNELEEVKKVCDDEAKERQSLMGRFRNLEHEYDGLSTVLEEELTSKENLTRQCQRAEAEANNWRLKFEKEGVSKIEELRAPR
jgi:chromosome segregation ATPase